MYGFVSDYIPTDRRTARLRIPNRSLRGSLADWPAGFMMCTSGHDGGGEQFGCVQNVWHI